MTVMVYYWLYLVPRYGFVSLLYLQDKKTRMYYQCILPDYAEEMGILGRTMNVATMIFFGGIFVNNIVMRKFEGQGSLEF